MRTCVLQCECAYRFGRPNKSCVQFSVQEYELIRVWDSLVFEDESEDSLTVGIQASGSFDPSQTRKVL